MIGKRLVSGKGMTRWLAVGGVVACLVAGAFAAGLHFAGDGQAAHVPAHRPGPEPSTPALDWTAFPAYRNAVPVLLYHSVGGKPSYLTTSTKLFAAQMSALWHGGFHPITMQQYVAYVHGHTRELPSRPILLTFDDGRRDAYFAATPILARYGFHATEFDIPGWIRAYPGFALPRADLVSMNDGRVWNVQLHFGYGKHTVAISRTGAVGSVFGYLRYLPAPTANTASTAGKGTWNHSPISGTASRPTCATASPSSRRYSAKSPSPTPSRRPTTARTPPTTRVSRSTCCRGWTGISGPCSAATTWTRAGTARTRSRAGSPRSSPTASRWDPGRLCRCSTAAC